MEEAVWKDMDLSSLNDHSCANQGLSLTPTLHNPPLPPPPPPPRHPHNHHRHSNPSFFFQDFFSISKPFCGDQPTGVTSTSRSCSHGDHRSNNNNTDVYRSLAPATVLSLNSGPPGFDFLDNSENLLRNNNNNNINKNCNNFHLQNHNSNSNLCSFNIPPFDALDFSSGLPCFGKRRFQNSDYSSSSDRRHKRMIKNRESAARSRARKQAYTHELENEIEILKQENARLKREQEEIKMAAASQFPKKSKLRRASTAPF